MTTLWRNKLNQFAFTTVVVTFTSFSCKSDSKKEKKGEVTAGPAGADQTLGNIKGFITSTDIAKPTTVVQYTADELKKEINFADEFTNHSNSAPTTACAKFINEQLATGTTSLLSFNTTVDLTSCSNAAQGANKVLNAQYRILIGLNCAGDDLARWNASTFGKLADNDLCPTASRQVKLLNGQLIQSGTQADSSGVALNYQNRISFSTATRTGLPCVTVRNSKNLQYSDCISTTRSDTTFPGAGTSTPAPTTTNTPPTTTVSDYSTFEFNVTFQNNLDRFYSSGTIRFSIGNWSGEMAYTSPTVPPTWTASNGTERASGTFTEESTSLNLIPRIRPSLRRTRFIGN